MQDYLVEVDCLELSCSGFGSPKKRTWNISSLTFNEGKKREVVDIKELWLNKRFFFEFYETKKLEEMIQFDEHLFLWEPKIYPPTQASTVTSTDCLYLCDACTLRVVHIILHTPPSPQTRLWDVCQRWCHPPPNQDAWWWGRWAWATAPTVRRLTLFRGSTRMPPQLPHPRMPPVAAMLLLYTAHLPVTCPVPPTACHMPCDPIPRSFSTLGVGLITCENQKSTHPHRRAQSLQQTASTYVTRAP